MNHRVVITGIGVVAPNGTTTDSFWNACLESKTAIGPIPSSWFDYTSFTSKLWAPLPPIEYNQFNINRIERMQIDMASVIGLAACKQAIDGAGLTYRVSDEKKNTFTTDLLSSSRCGVYVGTGIAGITTFTASQANHCFTPVMNRLDSLIKIPELNSGSVTDEILKTRQILRMPPRFNPFSVSMIMPNAAAALIGIKYGLTGPNNTYTSACASGTVAIGQAFSAISRGEIDCALAGGVEYLADEFGGIFRGFDIAKTLLHDCDTPETANRPFDKKRTGFLFAEGGGAIVVLESLESALRRGVQPVAEIAGFAESFDAYSMMAVEPSGSVVEKMIRRALDNAGVNSKDIDYINAHATGTQLNDDVEASVIERIFGCKPLVNATKSLIGHTIGAAGAIETAVTALSIRDQTTHICKNLDEPVRPLNFVSKPGRYSIKTALTQSFAFGGHNAALVLKSMD